MVVALFGGVGYPRLVSETVVAEGGVCARKLGMALDLADGRDDTSVVEDGLELGEC